MQELTIRAGLWLADHTWARLLVCAAMFGWAAYQQNLNVLVAFIVGMLFAFVMALGIGRRMYERDLQNEPEST